MSTSDRLLDAAEGLFARDGIAATSIRGITRRCGANVASVHYHFGSKEELLQAVCRRRLAPLNRERTQRLEALAETPVPPSVEAILRAFLEPTLPLLREHPDFTCLLGRLQAEAPALRAQLYGEDHFQEMVRALRRLLPRALPGASPAHLYWGIHFLVGAMNITWTSSQDVEVLSGGTVQPGDDAALLERLVRFGAAGLKATQSEESA